MRFETGAEKPKWRESMNGKFTCGIVAVAFAANLAGAEECANAGTCVPEETEAPTIAEVVKALGLEIYGQANVSLDYLDDGAGDGSAYLSDNASRLGFKGSTVVSDEVKLIWQMESAISFDENANSLSARNSYVGFDTPAGKVIAGRHDTPFKMLGCAGGLFINRVGDYRNVFGAKDATGAETFDNRLNNIVMYTSPSYSGVTATLAYVPEDGVENTEVYAGNVMYKSGDLLAGLAYEQHGVAFGNNGNAGGDEAKALRALVSYKMGDVKVNVAYESLMDADTTDYTRNSLGLGLSYDLSEKVVLKGQVYATDGDDTADDAGAVMYVMGVDYKLAPTTTLYVAAGLADNDSAAQFSMSGGGHEDSVTPAAPGEDSYGISFGLVHKFSYK